EDAVLLTRAGATLLLLEAVPDEVSARIIKAVPSPVIGCGAGRSCDGHVVVLHDVLGYQEKVPRFVEKLADVPRVIAGAARDYRQAIATGAYPAERHEYRMKNDP